LVFTRESYIAKNLAEHAVLNIGIKKGKYYSKPF